MSRIGKPSKETWNKVQTLKLIYIGVFFLFFNLTSHYLNMFREISYPKKT